jgi:hypothetical protein
VPVPVLVLVVVPVPVVLVLVRVVRVVLVPVRVRVLCLIVVVLVLSHFSWLGVLRTERRERQYQASVDQMAFQLEDQRVFRSYRELFLDKSQQRFAG